MARTEGLSGSDIATMVADALLQPVRELEEATHWRTTQGGGVTPCAASDPGALRRSLSELLPQQVTVPLLPSELDWYPPPPSSQVCPREACVSDFLLALEHAQRTVGEADLARFQEFTLTLGQTG